MALNGVNPIEIQRRVSAGSGSLSRPKASFGDFLAGVSAMNPFATEFTRQATGNYNAATVLNAAFASFPAAASAFSGSAPSWASAQYAGGPYGYTASANGMPNLGSHYPGSSSASMQYGGSSVVPGTDMPQYQLMEIMNQNNLQLIELQALMQSNMQTWNTKSNILSADHRAKMAMIEKFTARG